MTDYATKADLEALRRDAAAAFFFVAEINDGRSPSRLDMAKAADLLSSPPKPVELPTMEDWRSVISLTGTEGATHLRVVAALHLLRDGKAEIVVKPFPRDET